VEGAGLLLRLVVVVVVTAGPLVILLDFEFPGGVVLGDSADDFLGLSFG
jgi:hypothetical protein